MRFRTRLPATLAILAGLALPFLLDGRAADLDTERALKEELAAHPDSASLHVELAATYFRRGTVDGRALAIKAMKRALRLDPQNADYHAMLAEIFFEGTFWNYGVEELRRALELDSGHGFARGRLGEVYLERAAEEWQREWFLRAKEELLEVDSLHDAFHLAQRHLAQCYFDLGKPDSAVAVIEHMPADSLDTDDLLILGMAHSEAGDLSASFDAFSTALETMDEKTRSRYTSVALLATREETGAISDTRPARAASEAALLWKRRDPNPATEVNERLVEHFARVAFADLHFSVWRLDRPGSQTDRGEVYIRYGRPLAWFYDPFGTGICADETTLPRPSTERGRTSLGPDPDTDQNLGDRYRRRLFKTSRPRWTWQYRDFSLSFDDVFMNGDFTFPYEQDWSAYIYAYLKKELPEVYQSQIKRHMRVVLDVINLMDSLGRTGLKIVFACDTRGLEYEPHFEWPAGKFDIELAVLDSVYGDIARSRFEVDLRADSSVLYQTRFPLIGTYLVHVPPGSTLAAISVKSKINGAEGSTRRVIRARKFREHLDLSDIEFRFTADGPPNPSRVYLKRGKAYIAFSIYNLSTDESGTGAAEVSYRITGRKVTPSTFRRFLRFFSVDDEAGEHDVIASLWSKYDLRSKGSREDQVIGFDLSTLSSGEYEVEITVTDSLSGRRAVSRSRFVVASEIDL
jgi:GWxTD domain-containing protein